MRTRIRLQFCTLHSSFCTALRAEGRVRNETRMRLQLCTLHSTLCTYSKRLKQHLRHPRQSALGVADELLEDAVRHGHELFHPGQALAGEGDVFLPGGGFPE